MIIGDLDLAPTCSCSGCRVIGHGVEAGGVIFCCVQCAESDGEEHLRDRV